MLMAQKSSKIESYSAQKIIATAEVDDQNYYQSSDEETCQPIW